MLRFFKQIDASVPRGLGVHVVLDNLSAHSTPEIAKWLAHRDRRRWHLRYTPTSSSWLNLVERWFKELTDKHLRRGIFTSVADLAEAITAWATHRNTDPKPFIWKATTEDIITKVQRGRATLHQIKTQTHHWLAPVAFKTRCCRLTQGSTPGQQPTRASQTIRLRCCQPPTPQQPASSWT